jgi:hypothetical protein
MHTVRLIDGQQVSSESEQWRHECEARAIAKLSTREERDAWLSTIAIRRGEPAAERLRETMRHLAPSGCYHEWRVQSKRALGGWYVCRKCGVSREFTWD